MRPVLVLVLLALTPAAFPAVDAAATCQTLDRTVGAVAVHTETCHDSYVWYGYTYESFWNSTTVRAGSSALVADQNVHYVTRDASGTTVNDWGYHNYAVTATPSDAPVGYASVGVFNYQSRAGGGCYESTGLGAGHYGALNGGANEGVAYGGLPGTLPVPCTDADTQATLP